MNPTVRYIWDGQEIGTPSPFYYADGGRCGRGVPMGLAVYEGKKVYITMAMAKGGPIVLMTTRTPAELAQDTFLATLSTHFTVRPGSKRWPSDEPGDSPLDTFTCRWCKKSIAVRRNGEFASPDEPTATLYRLTQAHLATCPAGLSGRPPGPTKENNHATRRANT